MSNPLPHELTGNKSSNQLLVFLHGYPDTTAIWDKVIPSLEKDSYILNVTYPNYSSKEKNPKGADFAEIAERLKATIDQVNDTNRQVIAVAHDWGCIVSYSFDRKYPGYFSEMIELDIAPRWKLTLFAIFYQTSLAIAFIIGGAIGDAITRFILRKCFMYAPPWVGRIDSSWNFSYYYLWKIILRGFVDKKKSLFYGYKNSCPIVFVWGTKKTTQFYEKEWIDELVKDQRNEVHAMDSAHWIMLDHPNFLIDLVRRRLRMLRK